MCASGRARVRMHAYMHARMHACMYACMHVCMHVCTHACIHAGIHACIHACVHACVYACMCACMCECELHPILFLLVRVSYIRILFLLRITSIWAGFNSWRALRRQVNRSEPREKVIHQNHNSISRIITQFRQNHNSLSRDGWTCPGDMTGHIWVGRHRP